MAQDGTNNEPNNEPNKSYGYDYTNQAWVIDGLYVDCGHDHNKPCPGGNCFGRTQRRDCNRTGAIMFDKLIQFLFPKPKLDIHPSDLVTVLDYQKRLTRAGHVYVDDSSAGPSNKCKLVTRVDQESGRYVGNGNDIRWTVR